VRAIAPVAAAWCALPLFSSCASAPPRVPRPAPVVESFAAAIRTDKPRAAYALLDGPLREEIPYERFLSRWRENRVELKGLAGRLDKAPAGPAARARVRLQSGETVVLALDGEGWRIEGGVLDALSLQTPLDTVLALRRALRRRDLPLLLRVLSRKHRAAWQAAFEEAIEATSDPLDLEVEINGDRAVVHTTGGGSITLAREAGRWRVLEVK
jgi:hypothetical protein